MYYHKVLEVKLVLSEKIVVSLDTEFIKNENEKVSKQDSETEVAKRLLKRLAENYPEFPVCIQGGSLYETEPLMEICCRRKWKYLFTHKETRQKLLDESYEWIREGNGSTLVVGIGKEKRSGEYITHIEEVAGKKEAANLFSYAYKTKDDQTVRFRWLTDIGLTEKIGRNDTCSQRKVEDRK